MNTDTGYVFKVLLYFDILIASLLWRDSGITISAHCGLALRHGGDARLRWLGRVLNRISTGHCEKAIAHDRERAANAISALI